MTIADGRRQLKSQTVDEVDMTDVVELKNWRYAEPFKPFEMILDDGRKVLVKHPWNIGWSEEARTVAFATGPEELDWVKFSRVVEIRAARVRPSRKPRERKGRRGRS